MRKDQEEGYQIMMYVLYVNQQQESLKHSLRDCDFAYDIWNKFVNEDEWSRFFSLGSSQWLEANLRSMDFGSVQWQLANVFALVAYMIWQNRNVIVFFGNPPSRAQLLFNITRQVDLVNSNIAHPSPLPDIHPKHVTHISWMPSQVNVLKLNTDGSHNHSSGLSACGGVVRDRDGRFVTGFYCNLGVKSSYFCLC